jgi:hypothetical protein
MRIGVWWPDADPKHPERDGRTMNAPLVSLAFLVHVQWAGRRFTSGLLNAYASIYGLTDYEPTLAKMQYSKAAVRRMVRAAIDNPVNYRHIRSLSDVERARRAQNTLDTGTHVRDTPICSPGEQPEPGFCPVDGNPLPVRTFGPPATYCSPRCRMAAMRGRREAEALARQP